MRLVLASTSPARLATLRAAGVEPLTISPGVDEDAVVAAAGHLEPAEMVELLARAKAEAVAESHGSTIDGLILGGDSAFVIDGIIHGKPHLPEVARERWLRQRGRTGVLYSGHWLIDNRGGQNNAAVGVVTHAEVTFADVTDAEIDSYIATGEPLHVAGAFTIDSLGGPFIESIIGDPHTVVGLSLPALRNLVRSFGIEWTELWNR
ncbi:MAG: Maf family nucleotide pyrophosphatase [Microbacteriaceae bacterium]|nr:Maf family nucleotide pyrophosphatase [Microbacteriaceae bacterium]